MEIHLRNKNRTTKNIQNLDTWDFPGGPVAKTLYSQCSGPRFDPWFRKIPWKRKWQPTLVFLPGKSHGQRGQAGCSPWGCKESDKISQLGTSLVVQWLRLCAPNAGGLGSIPGRGTRPHTLLLRVGVPQLKDPTCCTKDQSPTGEDESREQQ